MRISIIFLTLLILSCNQENEIINKDFTIIYDDKSIYLKKDTSISIDFELKQFTKENCEYRLEVWVSKTGDNIFKKIEGFFTFKGIDYHRGSPVIKVGNNTFSYTPKENISTGRLVIMISRITSNPNFYSRDFVIPVEFID